MAPVSVREFIRQQKNISKEYPNHNFLYNLSITVLIVFISLIFLPVPYVITIVIYIAVLSLVIFTNNDTVSLIIGYFIGNALIASLNLNPLLYVIAWSPIVFFIVDYEVRMTIDKVSLVRASTLQEINDIKGSVLLKTSNTKDLIYFEQEYYLLDKKSNRVDIYATESKYDIRRNSLVNFFRKRSQKRAIVEEVETHQNKDE